MNITIEPFEKSFNINFHRKEGEEAFLSIKGCRIMQGAKGPFLSFPATKLNTGKWINHAWCDDKFQSAVMQMVDKPRPKPPKPQADDDSIPF